MITRLPNGDIVVNGHLMPFSELEKEFFDSLDRIDITQDLAKNQIAPEIKDDFFDNLLKNIKNDRDGNN